MLSAPGLSGRLTGRCWAQPLPPRPTINQRRDLMIADHSFVLLTSMGLRQRPTPMPQPRHREAPCGVYSDPRQLSVCELPVPRSEATPDLSGVQNSSWHTPSVSLPANDCATSKRPHDYHQRSPGEGGLMSARKPPFRPWPHVTQACSIWNCERRTQCAVRRCAPDVSYASGMATANAVMGFAPSGLGPSFARLGSSI
jgi:hypothetical protein